MIFHAHLGNALSINQCGQCETKGGLIMFPSRAESVSHVRGNIMLSYRTDVQVAPFLQTWWAFLPPWPNLENTTLGERHAVEHEPYFHFNLAVIGLAQSKREISMLQLARAPWMMVFWFYSQEKRKWLNKTNRQKKKESLESIDELSHVLRWFHDRYVLIGVSQSSPRAPLYST